ncbi:MAG: ubiquinol-cytochrome c reductase iron-sulfur subunit [Bacillota bacterium]
MDRKSFLLTSGKAAAFAALSTCFLQCSKDNSNSINAPQNVDFTIDLSTPEGQVLNNVSGALYKNGIVIARISQTQFTALSQACTHQGTTVNYEAGNNRFHCPNHGSNFDVNGNVINGPASRNLTKYNVTLNGNLLRIYS